MLKKSGDEILGAEGLGGAWLANIGTSHRILSKDQSRHMGATLSGIFSPPPFYLAPALLLDTAGAEQALALR